MPTRENCRSTIASLTVPARRSRRAAIAVTLGAALLSAARTPAGELIPQSGLAPIGLQTYWQTRISLPAADWIERMVVIDDNVYLLTADNRAYCLHAPTGVVRWSREVAAPGQTLRGPTHTQKHAVFTSTTAIRLVDRQTGRFAGEPRNLKGTLIEVRGDRADVSLGRLHGVSPGDVLEIRRGGDVGQANAPIAALRCEIVRERESTGRFTELDQGNLPRAGDAASASIELPIDQLRLPNSSSSAAVADGQNVYYGAANQRFYSLEIIGGYRAWELLTPKTISAEPLIDGEQLYLAGQNGQVTKVNARDRTGSWPEPFKTEGPIFAKPALSRDLLFVSSTDRSVYALRTANGRRAWRQRFDAELVTSPVPSGDLVAQYVPGEGVVALERSSGERRWRHEPGLSLLTRIGEYVYVAVADAPARGAALESPALTRLDARTGQPAGATLLIAAFSFVSATADPPAIFAADKRGNVVCLRSVDAPYLRSTEVADALHDEAAEAVAKQKSPRLPARPTSRPAAPPPAVDPFASKSTAPPAAASTETPHSPAAATPPATATSAPTRPATEDESTDGKDDETPSEEDSKEE